MTVPCVYYDYDNIKGLSEVEFTLINDKVMEMLTYTDLSYVKGQDILSRLGIAKPENTYKAVDQKTAVRYRCPTTAIDDVWIGNIDSAKDTFGFLRVTYDLFYSEQWYMPDYHPGTGFFHGFDRGRGKVNSKVSEVSRFSVS